MLVLRLAAGQGCMRRHAAKGGIRTNVDSRLAAWRLLWGGTPFGVGGPRDSTWNIFASRHPHRHSGTRRCVVFAAQAVRYMLRAPAQPRQSPGIGWRVPAAGG